MHDRQGMSIDSSFGGVRYAMEPLNSNFGIYTQVGSVIVSARSPYQTLEIMDTPQYGRVLRLDGYTMTTEEDEFHYHEGLVHVAATAHAAPEEVLIIGGGDCGAAKEALKYKSIVRIDLVEIDAMVVEFSKRYLSAVHGDAHSSPRLKIHIDDGYAWIGDTSARFDLIVLDLTDPVGPAHALYTVDFYKLCRTRLKPGGIICLHAESPYARPQTFQRIVATLKAVFACVRPYLVFVPSYGTVLAMVCASLDVDPARLPEQEVDRRLSVRGVAGLKWFCGETHNASFALPTCVRRLLASEVQIVSKGGLRLDDSAELAVTARPDYINA